MSDSESDNEVDQTWVDDPSTIDWFFMKSGQTIPHFTGPSEAT